MAGPIVPNVAYERYAKPPLKAMLGQVHFPPIVRLSKGVSEVADLQEAIRGTFPGFGEEHRLQIAFGPGVEPTTLPTERSAGFRCVTEDEAWTALLTSTHLTLEAVAGAEYSSFERFAELFRELWSAIDGCLKPGRVSQQGLRYVDHLEGSRTIGEWAGWINPALLGSMAEDPLAAGIQRLVTEALYEDDTGRFVFRHGVAQAGPANADGYLLDFDYIHTTSVDASEIDAIMDRFGESHEQLYAFFRWCVTDRAVEEFRDAGG